MIKQRVTIHNASGLHARPANQFARSATAFQSDIIIQVGNRRYNAKSIISILQACIKSGTEIEIEAEGADEQEAVTTLCKAVEAGFHLSKWRIHTCGNGQQIFVICRNASLMNWVAQSKAVCRRWMNK